MIPFERTWPYDIIMKDIYVPSCPFCGSENVLLPIRPIRAWRYSHRQEEAARFSMLPQPGDDRRRRSGLFTGRYEASQAINKWISTA